MFGFNGCSISIYCFLASVFMMYAPLQGSLASWKLSVMLIRNLIVAQINSGISFLSGLKRISLDVFSIIVASSVARYCVIKYNRTKYCVTLTTFGNFSCLLISLAMFLQCLLEETDLFNPCLYIFMLI